MFTFEADMQYYLHLNNTTQGPFTRQELIGMNISPLTPVWYEGLDDWMPAAKAPETAFLFTDIAAGTPDTDAQAGHTTITSAPTSSSRASLQASAITADDTDRPRSYLTGSILVTVLAFTLAGIVAIYYALRTRSALRYRDYTSAARYSDRSQLWIIISIVLGLISGYLQTMYMLGEQAAGV